MTDKPMPNYASVLILHMLITKLIISWLFVQLILLSPFQIIKLSIITYIYIDVSESKHIYI